MVARADILAGRAVIFIDIQDTIEKQLRSIRSKLRMFTAGVSEIGGDLFRGGIAGSFASYFPVKEFVNFQDQLLFLQTKLQVTDAQLKPLEKKIRDLGMTTSFSSTEVGKAATMFAQAGFSLQETSDALQASLDLARGGQVDLTTSTTILANAIRTFGADASQAAEYASKFIAAARLGTLDIVDLGQSLTYSSGTFAQLGVDIEYVLGLITTLSKSGLKASLAGTSLNTAFLNLSGSADELQEKLGIALTMQDFQEPLVGLTKIQLALDKLSKFEQLKVVQDLVNIRGGRAIFGTFLQGLNSLEDVTNQIRNSADEARLSAIKLDSRLGGVGRRAVSAFQELQLAIGSTAEGPLTTIGERAAAVFNDMSRLAQINPQVVQTLLIMGPAALAAGVGLLTLTTIAGKLAMLLTPLMMLNGVVFQLAGNLAGLKMKQLSDIYFLFSRIRRMELPAIPLNFEYNLGTDFAAFLVRLETLFSDFFRGLSGSPIRVPRAEFQPFQPGARGTYGYTPFAGKGIGFDPRVFAPTAARDISDAPAENLTKALNRVGGLIVRPFRDLPEAASNSKQASQNLLTYTKMLVKPVGPQQKFKQLDLPFQFELDFSESKPLTSFLKTAPATAQFNAEAESIISKIVQRVLGSKVAKRELSRSGNQELELQRRLASVFRKFPVPKELIPRILADVKKQLNSATVKPPEKFVQQLFNFDNIIEETASNFSQLPLPLTTDLPKQEVAFKGYLMRITKEAQTTAKTIKAQQTGLSLLPSQKFLGGPGGQIIDGVVRSGGEIGATRQMGRGVSFELSRAGKAGARLRSIILDTVRILGEMGRNTVSILVNGLTNVLVVSRNIFSSLYQGVRSVGRFIVGTNWLHEIIETVTGLGRFLRGVFSVLNGIRRVVFSLSGILTIVEVLILFGDKIPVVKDILEGLGNAFSNLFKNLGNTLKALGPSFQLIGRGFNDMFGGNAERGLQRIKDAFSDIGQTIRTGVWAAWQQFLADIAPGADRIKEIIKGVMATFNALIASIGGVFGTALEGGEIIIKGDSTLMDTLSNVFSTENIKSFFLQLVAAIESIGLGLISAVGFIGNVLIEIRKVFMAMLQSLANIPGLGGSAQEALSSMNEPTGYNADEIKRARAQAKNLEEILNTNVGFGMSDASRKNLEAQLQDVYAYLSFLGDTPTNNLTSRIDIEAQQQALSQKIAEIVKGLMAPSSTSTPEIAAEAAAQAVAGAASREAMARGMDTISGIIGTINWAAALPSVTAKVNKEAIKDQIDQANAMKTSVAKAVVGDFQSTRGSMLQMVPRMEKLQEKANDHLEGIEGGIASLTSKTEPFVYQT